MRIIVSSTLLIAGVLGGSAQAQPKVAAADQIVALVGASRPSLSVAAPLIELDDLGAPAKRAVGNAALLARRARIDDSLVLRTPGESKPGSRAEPGAPGDVRAARVARVAPAALDARLEPTDRPFAGSAAAAPVERFLAPREISAQVSPHEDAIERCYLGQLGELRRGSRLDLTLVIGRDGRVVSLATAAPGLAAGTARKVSRCVHGVLGEVRFPVRRRSITAVVPYLFHKIEAPDAGPQLSCWDPKGCR